MSDGPFTLLVATVGGSAAPVVASLKHWRPCKVWFVTSREARGTTDEILSAAQSDGLQLDSSRTEYLEVEDPQNFRRCVWQLRDLSPHVAAWLARGQPEHRVVADFTGGTKCLSAALALHARRWPCAMSYVGGRERANGGLGAVVPGAEMVVQEDNPWDLLGFHAIEEACALFDEGAFESATAALDSARRSVTDPTVKRELTAVHDLTAGYAAWDAFRHKDAAALLGKLDAGANDLRAVFGSEPADELLRTARQHRRELHDLGIATGATRELALDLLANAERRAAQGRFDDAVARLYRAVEALAQARLRDTFGIETSAAPVDRLPDSLRRRLRPDGTAKLGLQDAFSTLEHLRDPLGQLFQKLGLDRRDSPLSTRNQSVLAHGFQPTSERTYAALRKAALQLAEIEEGALPRFPRLQGQRADARL